MRIDPWTGLLPFHRRAWHAGVSTWRGRPACNDFSIGIELEGADALLDAAAEVLGELAVYVAVVDRARAIGADGDGGRDRLGRSCKEARGAGHGRQREEPERRSKSRLHESSPFSPR
jgi:AmpD protein